MKYRRRIYYTESQIAETWDRWYKTPFNGSLSPKNLTTVTRGLNHAKRRVEHAIFAALGLTDPELKPRRDFVLPSCPEQDIPGGIVVPVECQVVVGALVGSIGEFLLHDLTTTRALLAGAMGFDANNCPTSTFSLVGQLE